MDKELIDKAWACLPKEFKEEVKEIFRKCLGVPKYEAITIKPMLLGYLFGHHNLTSDEEGVEMVCCPKYKIGSVLDYCDELDAISGNSNMRNWGEQMIAYLFGSKCLPEEDAHEDNFATKKPQPAEPKFKHKIGDKVRIVNDISHNNKYKGDITEIVYIDESNPNAPYKVDIYDEEFGVGLWCQESDLEPYTAAEQPMTDSETEHTKDEFVARMRGKFTEQDFTEAKQRTESCVASLSQFELPKQIETQIDEAMAGIEAEAQRQYGNFGAANADIAIPVYRHLMRLGALLALSAGDLESEQTDTDRGDYISMTKPTDPNK